MKRIIAAFTGKVEKMKMERKLARVNRAIDSARDNAQDVIDRIEEEKAKLIERLADASEVNPIIEQLSDKIGQAEEQQEIIKRLDKVMEYINEEVDVEEEKEK